MAQSSLLNAPHDAFIRRHIGINAQSLPTMLQAVGAATLDQLIEETIPEGIRMGNEMELPAPLTEQELLAELARIGDKNALYRNYIGAGYYGTLLPGVIQRNILENPGWYTQYTPYQAEIAQ
ncbi:MAG: glycine dehydrogenase (aminomethyl-transferring), partial [Bacteroidota bacterium]